MPTMYDQESGTLTPMTSLSRETTLRSQSDTSKPYPVKVFVWEDPGSNGGTLFDRYFKKPTGTTIAEDPRHFFSVEGEYYHLHVIEVKPQYPKGLLEMAIRSCSCAVLVYDTTSRTSFNQLQDCIARIQAIKGPLNASSPKPFHLSLVGGRWGSKDRREVSEGDAQNIAYSLPSCQLTEIAFDDDDGIRRVFMELIEAVHELRIEEEYYSKVDESSNSSTSTKRRSTLRRLGRRLLRKQA